MSATGYLLAHVYTSSAQLPLQDTAIVNTADDGTALAMRVTDISGLIRVVELPVPDRSESLTPDEEEKPYTTVNLFARKSGYEQIACYGLQIFADTTTYQDLEMIPLPEFPGEADLHMDFITPPQNL